MSEKKDSTVTSVRLDDDVNHFRETECSNFTELVNDLVREYMQTGLKRDVIHQYRIQEIQDEIDGLRKQLEHKREKLEAIEDSPDPEIEEYKEYLEEKANLYPDPNTGAIQDIADKFDKDAQTVAEDLADMFNKEVPTDNGLEYWRHKH